MVKKIKILLRRLKIELRPWNIEAELKEEAKKGKVYGHFM